VPRGKRNFPQQQNFPASREAAKEKIQRFPGGSSAPPVAKPLKRGVNESLRASQDCSDGAIENLQFSIRNRPFTPGPIQEVLKL